MANRFLDTFPYFTPYFIDGANSAQMPPPTPTQHPPAYHQQAASGPHASGQIGQPFNYQNSYYGHFMSNQMFNRLVKRIKLGSFIIMVREKTPL